MSLIDLALDFFRITFEKANSSIFSKEANLITFIVIIFVSIIPLIIWGEKIQNFIKNLKK